MKLKIIIIVLLFLTHNTIAQYKHHFCYNTIQYTNFYNKEKDKLSFPYNLLAYNFSYKFTRKKIGIELNYNNEYGIMYYPIQNKYFVPENSILWLNSAAFSVKFCYKALDKKYIRINTCIGIVKNKYAEFTLINWQFHSNVIDHIENNNIGIDITLNAEFPLYKNFYLNNNLKFFTFPKAKYNKQNLLFEVGIGYILQKKIKPKK